MSAPTSALVKFWNDEQVDIHPSRLRKDIPPMPKITKDLQTVRGGAETLAFLVVQVQKSTNKEVIVRAIASAVAILFDDTKNYTGSPTAPVALSGLEPLVDETITDRNVLVETNFRDAEPVTLLELDRILDIDSDEIGSYFGVLCLAAVKSINTKNRAAFNEKRQNAVQATTIGEMKIFAADSEFLTDAIVQKVYASFNSYLPVRSHMILNAVGRLNQTSMGPTLAFTTMFLLLVDQGMSALRIIKECLVKHKWLLPEFPELNAEVEAAQQGLISINKAPPQERSFIKSIHGASYVPVAYSSIANLTGLCKFVMKETTISYANYDGGQVTEAQEAKLTQLMIARGLMRGAAATNIEQE